MALRPEATCPDDVASIWREAAHSVQATHDSHETVWSDWKAWDVLTDTLSSWTHDRGPQGIIANSASARYAQWFIGGHRVGMPHPPTAGWRASTSAPPLGWHAKTRAHREHTTWLITGDIAFHYDANAMLCSPSLNREG